MDDYSGYCDTDMWRLFMEIYDIDDEGLVDEVMNMTQYETDNVETHIDRFMFQAELTKEGRDCLIGYYILVKLYGDG